MKIFRLFYFYCSYKEEDQPSDHNPLDDLGPNFDNWVNSSGERVGGGKGVSMAHSEVTQMAHLFPTTELNE